MKRKKLYLRDLERHDEQQDDCVVRALEMTADAVLISPGYTLQFWRDVQLYGVDEALLYVANGKHGDHETLTREWEQLRRRMVPQEYFPGQGA